MRILLVNDDGIHSDGLMALIRAFAAHDLTVVAPDSERSGFSTSFTYYKPIEVRKHIFPEFPHIPAYAISGSPADCTKMGLRTFCKEKPDLVISGINRGANLGTDIAYSGTFGGALEAAMFGTPAFSVSQQFPVGAVPEGDTATRTKGETPVQPAPPMDFTYAAGYLAGLAESLEGCMPANLVLNVNFPVDAPGNKGVRVTRPAVLEYQEYYEYLGDTEEGTALYHLRGELQPGTDKTADDTALDEGYISICPLGFYRCDLSVEQLLLSKGIV